MEYRGRPERVRQTDAGAAAGSSGAGVPQRSGAAGQRHELPGPGSLARRSQYPGGSTGRYGQADDSQPAQPLLRAAEHGGVLDESRAAGKSGSGDDGVIDKESRNILDSLSSGVILLDRNLLIAGLNPAAENILGISQLRARGESLLRLVDDEPELRDILSRVIATGDHYANELRLAPTEVHAEERIVDCRVSPICSESARLLVELTDVTRRTRISRENALLIQHGAGRQMIRQLAHEIKNPLGGIRGAAQLLARQLDNDELTEYTDVIISETDRLAGLVDTLLGPGGPPNKQPLNIHELLEYVVRIIEAEDEKSLHIRRDYDPGLPLIDLDRDQMVQAFLNLVRNAATALQGQGTITLRSRAVTNFTIGDVRHRVIASIEIEDDGPGIPADLQDTVFYPLVTGNPHGTGLGLPAAQELISRHGGLIEFESRPGRTVFIVQIPLEQAEPGR
ncbi:MAG: PAS domain-containing protein [Woeseiaceae bacterium]|nr:PAS domain-containing protein [Woeseiaceae bacterium]